MAGNMTQVDLAGLQKAINVFSEGVANFDSQYKSMSATISGLSSSWTGHAHQAFDSAMQSWLADFLKVVNVLNGMENALSQNTSVLTQTNEETIQKAQQAAANIAPPRLPGF